MTKENEQLIQLIKENPDLPVVPMVYYDVVNDEYGYWEGKWGKCYVTDYIAVEELNNQIFFKEDGFNEEVVLSYIFEEEYLLMSDEEAKDYFYNSIPWKRAIIVFIHER